jgi:hypothetical protein
MRLTFKASMLATGLLAISLHSSANNAPELTYLNSQPQHIIDAGCAMFHEQDYGQPNARWVGMFDYAITPAVFGINGEDVNLSPQGNGLVNPGQQVTASANGVNLRITAGENIPCDFECSANKAKLELTDSSGQSNSYSVIFQCDI